jgi:hypothetical protein
MSLRMCRARDLVQKGLFCTQHMCVISYYSKKVEIILRPEGGTQRPSSQDTAYKKKKWKNHLGEEPDDRLSEQGTPVQDCTMEHDQNSPPSSEDAVSQRFSNLNMHDN